MPTVEIWALDPTRNVVTADVEISNCVVILNGIFHSTDRHMGQSGIETELKVVHHCDLHSNNYIRLFHCSGCSVTPAS